MFEDFTFAHNAPYREFTILLTIQQRNRKTRRIETKVLSFDSVAALRTMKDVRLLAQHVAKTALELEYVSYRWQIRQVDCYYGDKHLRSLVFAS